MAGKRVYLVVLDGLGVGGAPDANRFGDVGANTLSHVLERSDIVLPNFESLGLGNLGVSRKLKEVPHPIAFHGILEEVSAGKDTVTGHWEMMGLTVEEAFPLFPGGFPGYVMKEFTRKTGYGTLWNRPASGTEIIEKLGMEHLKTKKLIIYTSADSVFQIAAHREVVSGERLYEICRVARRIVDPLKVLRVIARPFAGTPGNFFRTGGRRDFPLEPGGISAVDLLNDEGIEVISIGKVGEMFSGRGFSSELLTGDNSDGIRVLKETMKGEGDSLVFANLNDFDTLYGHRNDVSGFASALLEVDRDIPSLLELLCHDQMLIFTADHGNDPTFPGTDHTRERVPVLVIRKGVGGTYLGVRKSFATIGATILDFFSIPVPFDASGFSEVLKS